MSDREDEPAGLLDAAFRLDDIADWLCVEGYEDIAAALAQISSELKGYIVISDPPSREVR